jgi:tetratricopeptide (TPR) repeat protein
MRRALAIGEKALGPDNPDVAAILSNLAALLEAKGDYVAAEPVYRRALAIVEKALGPDNLKPNCRNCSMPATSTPLCASRPSRYKPAAMSPSNYRETSMS